MMLGPPVINNDSGASNITMNSATLDGYLSLTGGYPTYVWVYWGPTDGQNANSNWANTNYFGLEGIGLLTTNVTGLTSNSMYYYRFYATNVIGAAWASPSSNFMTLGPPVINNDGGASNVMAHTATLDGNLILTGGCPTYVWVYWGPTDGQNTNSDWAYPIYFGLQGVGLLTANITGLTPSTNYYYRFYAMNGVGETWASSSASFTTKDVPWVDNDGGASNVTANSATLDGDLTSTGGCPTYVWVYWGPTDGQNTNSNWAKTNYFGLRGVGLLTANITGLTPGAMYYYRLYATNQQGTAWASPSANFTTKDVPALDNDGGASNVTANTATLDGDLTSTGGCPTYVWVYWGPTDGQNTNNKWANSNYFGLQSIGLLTANITGLTPSTNYYYRFYATNVIGAVWASPSTNFTTLGPPVVDNGGGAANIGIGTATLQGNLTVGGSANVYIYWGASDGGTTQTNWTTNAYLGTLGQGAFSTNVSGLFYGLQYYYRCYATNACGSAWASSTTNFTTFNPTQPVTNGLELWLDASQTTGLVDGVQAAVWPDMSGSGNDATLAASSTAPYPMYKTNQINGLPVMRFSADGNSYFVFNELTNVQTVFWVLNEASYSDYEPFLMGDNTAYDFHRGPGGNIWSPAYASPNVVNGTTKLMGSVVDGTATVLNPGWAMISLVTVGNVNASQVTQDRGQRLRPQLERGYRGNPGVQCGLVEQPGERGGRVPGEQVRARHGLRFRLA